MNPLTIVIAFFTCALLAMTDGLLIPPRCMCTTTETKEISYNRIVKMAIFKPGPHCKNTEIIATVKLRKEIKLCLDPKEKWVQDALKSRNLVP